jgi:putative colanic acid biosynthesis UDP-glucose lipid carrier transferase
MGLDGRRFTILKFRTMRPDAESTTGAVWAVTGDPRRTRIGALLRRFSLDELPQLLNVLRGDMSLVGPRPERPVFIEVFRERLPGYMRRHHIPAGLTGWAQIHGLRGESDLSERLSHDLHYLSHWSLLLDIEILLRTAWHVLVGRNAG